MLERSSGDNYCRAYVLVHCLLCLCDSLYQGVCNSFEVLSNLTGCNLVIYNIPEQASIALALMMLAALCFVG